jgi:glucose/arabinose dehydrogenase
MVKFHDQGDHNMFQKAFRTLGFSFAIGLIAVLQQFAEPVSVVRAEVIWPSIEIMPVVSGLSAPVQIANAGDGSERLFVVERRGTVQIVESGSLLSTPFLDIQDRVQAGGEEGLLSIAFPPSYAAKGYFYVYYTNHNGDNQVSRFSISADPNIADSSSEKLILYLDHPAYSNHNGGQMAFGPDGYLYIGTGDGGGGGDPDGNGQNTDSLLGKILRIDVEWASMLPVAAYSVYLPLLINNGEGNPLGQAYRIPDDNPFRGMAGHREEIWAFGLRNPWRFSFDRNTGDLYIGDVGQGSWEEVDFQLTSSPGGENYGWNEMEGMHCYLPNCDTAGMTLPVYEYPTHEQGGCSITGGFVYRGVDYPGMQGIYLFADYCNGRITGLVNDSGTWQSQLLLDTSLSPSSFGESESGELYIADLSSGTIYQIVEQAPGN